ncbi:MAG: hypothetical protein KDA25_05650, partial [Phycisphaerales bacterium]|nr:hypothetical protein [Phycisphaerales bacterium]
MLMRCASSLVLLPLAGVLMLGGCDRSASDVAAPTVTTRPADPAASSETGGIQSWKPSRDPRIASFLGLETTKPVMWIEHPPLGADRITQFTIPGVPPAEAAHLIVFHFDETGGGPLDLNIRRWEA